MVNGSELLGFSGYYCFLFDFLGLVSFGSFTYFCVLSCTFVYFWAFFALFSIFVSLFLTFPLFSLQNAIKVTVMSRQLCLRICWRQYLHISSIFVNCITCSPFECTSHAYVLLFIYYLLMTDNWFIETL